MRTCHPIAILLICLLLLAGCGGGGGPAPNRPVSQVAVTITDQSLAISDSIQAQVDVRDAEGRILQDRSVSWSSSDPAVATVNQSGVVAAMANGIAGITASVESVSSSVRVTVSPLGTITVHGDSVVELAYPDLFDVFTEPDPERYPNIRTQPDHWDAERILRDLNAFADVDEYDFVLVYTSQEVPQWINSGPDFYVPAKNIGRRNSDAGERQIGYSRFRAAPHMNWVEFATDNDPDPVLIAIHEMAHHWGVYMVGQYSIGPREWIEGEHHVSFLASCCAHWTFAFSEGQQEETDMPGIMASGPTRPTFNPFDLYAMGLMDYTEASAHSYLVAPVPEPPSGPHRFYEINLDLLIEGMRITRPGNFEGDGKRIPSLDPEMALVKTLVVLATGEADAISNEQIEKLMSIATDLSAAWDVATWSRSQMSTELAIRE